MAGEEDKKGRCVGCGFFSAWYPPANCHIEVNANSRVTLEFAGQLAEAVWAFECVVNEANLRNEQEEARKPDNDKKRALRVVMDKDRKCPKFYLHRPGFTPKEHVTMMLSEQMVQAQKDLLAEEKAANKERLEEEKKANDARRVDDGLIADRRWKLGIIFGAIQAVGVAILAAILVILAEPWKERAKQSVQPAVNQNADNQGK